MGEKTFKRISIGLTPELERVVLDLRKTEEFCRCSYAEIIRVLMTKGAEVMAGSPSERRGADNAALAYLAARKDALGKVQRLEAGP